MSLPSTVRSALALSRSALCDQSDSPNLDGQLLLSQVLERPRAWLLAHPESKIEKQDSLQFLNLLDRCVRGEALPHVLGWWEFYGRRFRLNGSVLIPRPETELMVDAALEHLERYSRPMIALDVGTGSGCVAITLAREVSELRIYATDLSMEALNIAQTNVSIHSVDHTVRLICADLVSPISLSRGFDLVCANLPYIPEGGMDKLQVSKREPRIALDGGKDGLSLIRRLLDSLPQLLAKRGRALLEIGYEQAESVLQYVEDGLAGYRAEVRADLAGLHRLVVVDRWE